MWAQNYKKIAIVCRKKCIFVSVNPDAIHNKKTIDMEQNQPQPPVFNPQQAQQPAPQYQPRVTASPTLDPVTAVTTCLKKFFDFKGRARRSEYWWFILFTIIVSAAFNYCSSFLPFLSYIGLVVSLLLTIPMLAALTRRLHDTGRSGWWVLLFGVLIALAYGSLFYVFYPVADQLKADGDYMALAKILADAFQGSPTAATVYMFSAIGIIVLFIITLIFSVMDSKWGANKYGPSPKYQ